MKATPGENILSSLKNAISAETRPMTLADASTKSGCSLYDTKEGLNYLIAEYRGNLAATSEGELLYSFPTGFTKPWQTQENLARVIEKIKKTTLGVLKFRGPRLDQHSHGRLCRYFCAHITRTHVFQKLRS